MNILRRLVFVASLASLIAVQSGCSGLAVSDAARQSVATFFTTVVNTAINNSI